MACNGGPSGRHDVLLQGSGMADGHLNQTPNPCSLPSSKQLGVTSLLALPLLLLVQVHIWRRSLCSNHASGHC